jgi:hypothetical protein
MPTKKISQQERIARRGRMAKDVKQLLRSGAAVDKALAVVSNRYRVGSELVRSACRQHRVVLPRKPPTKLAGPSLKTLRIIAQLMKKPAELSDRNNSAIAREHGITRQRVGQIKREALEAGVLRR